MARPQRKKRICSKPKSDVFVPKKSVVKEYSILTLDEYETIRWIDYQKMTHEQCAKIMDISRTTVTEIYESARFKMADCLMNGKELQISGGNYKLCLGEAANYCQMGCKKSITSIGIEKGENVMRIAVTYNKGDIFQHFGHTEQFKLYDIEDEKVVKETVIDTNENGHGALAGLLASEKVDVLICGGIGGGAQTALVEAGIKLYGGVSGNAEEAIQSFLGDRLDFNPNVVCSHHHEGEHSCGEDKHRCGEN